MLIRVDGREDGVKEYLEHGRKEGRRHTRDQLDDRVVLAGSLEFTDAVVQSIAKQDGQARYLSITLAFREDHVDPETLRAIAREFEAFVFGNAYQPGEYCFYAEAHLPRMKSYIDQKTGDLVERKPHIHVVIPKRNLLTGGHLEPLGFVKSNIQFIDAWQESVNARFGLASPKDHRRVQITDASEMISRYSGDAFGQGNRDVKEQLLEQILARDIRSDADLRRLLAEFGEVRQRHAGREDAYWNVKPFGAAKGINLKEYVFSSEFLARPLEDKQRELMAQVQPEYTEVEGPREVPAEISRLLDQWRESRALEVKYLANGQAMDRHRALSPEQQAQVLEHLHRTFYLRHQEGHDDDSHRDPHRDQHRDNAPRRGDDRAVAGDDLGRPAGRFPGAGTDPGEPDGPWDGQSDPADAGPQPLAAAGNGLRDLPVLAVVRGPGAAPVLLPGDASRGVEHPTARVADPLRWPDERHERAERTGRHADSAIEQLARDAREAQRAQVAADLQEFATIRRELDATRLLAELSHSHGVLVQKYEVLTAADGSPRIKVGSQRLNVADFLTRELRLPWQEASAILRDCHARQRRGDPILRARELPRARLWQTYVVEREGVLASKRRAWKAQRESEQLRKAAIQDAFKAARQRAAGDRTLRRPERKAAISAARAGRALALAHLGAAVTKERDALRQIAVPSFNDYLRRLASQGDEQALEELRRTRVNTLPPATDESSVIRPADAAAPANEIIWREPSLKWEVMSGGQILYRRGADDVLRDDVQAIVVLRPEHELIEAGLRLAQARFGATLDLAGPPVFRLQAARVAAEAGLRLTFTDPALNMAMDARRAELLDERLGRNRGALRGRAAEVPASDQMVRQPDPAARPAEGTPAPAAAPPPAGPRA